MLSQLKSRLRSNKVRLSVIVALAIVILSSSTPNSFFPISAGAYDIIVDNNVDDDSDIDGITNIGNSGTTNYTHAQTIDGFYETLQEDRLSLPPETEDTNLTSVDDMYMPDDLGSYSNWTEMKYLDGKCNNLTEETDNEIYDVPFSWDQQMKDWKFGSVYGLDNDTELLYADGLSFDTVETRKKTTDPYNLGWQYTWYPASATKLCFGVRLIYKVSDGENFQLRWSTSDSGVGTFLRYLNSTEWEDTGTIQVNETAATTIYIFITDDMGLTPDTTQTVFYLDYMHVCTTHNTYRFDREFQFFNLPIYQETYELYTYIGDVDAEGLFVQVLHDDVWTHLFTIATGNIFVVTDVTHYLIGNHLYFRFIDESPISNSNQDMWQIDCVFIKTTSGGGNNYRLVWEHQAQNLDVHKDDYKLALYGYSTAELFYVDMWCPIHLEWETTDLQINTTLQWYNITIPKDNIDSTLKQLTWRYVDISKSSDNIQDTLYIDYVAIIGWNFSIDILQESFNLEEYNQDSGMVIFDAMPLNIKIESGVSCNMYVRAIDGMGYPVAKNYLWIDSDTDPNGSTLLSSDFQLYYEDIPVGLSYRYLYVFVYVPHEIANEYMTFTLEVKIEIN